MSVTVASFNILEKLSVVSVQFFEVVALRFFAGYSTQEIAAAMGKREGAVYSLEVRAIGALRRTLGIDLRKFPAGADKKAGSPGIDRVR